MKTSISIGSASATGEDWDGIVSYVLEAERLGVDNVWSAEGWGQDAATPLAALAPLTSRIILGTGIMQVTARAPAMTAMTALSLDRLTGGRFVLGLGVSGPQVVEGLHGVRFSRPLERLRETLDVLGMALGGERISFSGRQMRFPLPDGEGKSIALAMPPRPDLPIYLATLGERSLELTGERAQGWLGTCFVPERADVFWGSIGRGAARAGRSLDALDLQAGGRLWITDNVEGAVSALRPELAFRLGAMGSATSNFYNDAYRRAGWEEECQRVRSLWIDRRRKEAIEAVPDDLVLRSNLIGPPAAIRERLAVYRRAGVTTLRLDPVPGDVPGKLDQLGQLLDLLRDAGLTCRPTTGETP